MNSKPKQTPLAHLMRDYLILLGAAVAIRVPFWGNFSMVTFDGTYYLNQAKALVSGIQMPGAFPIGYPAAAALVHFLVPDITLAGRIVSVVSGLAALLVLYHLALRFTSQRNALYCGLLFAIHPLFVRLSLETMSEPFYLLWLLLGVLLFSQGRDIWSGAVLGLAAITRPEAIAVAGIFAASRYRAPHKLLAIAAAFVVVYSTNVLVMTNNTGKLTLLPKTENIAASASAWTAREATVEFEGKEDAPLAMYETRSAVVDYIIRLPHEVGLLLRFLLPVLLALAVFGAYRKRTVVLLAPLVPFLIYPAATPRPEARFILPYVPFLLVLAFIGYGGVRKENLRKPTFVLLGVSALLLLVINGNTMTTPQDREYKFMRRSGKEFSSVVNPGDRIADRKPYFAFYAGGEYVEIPLTPYDVTIQYLCDNDVKFLALQQEMVSIFRPALAPLLHDRAVIKGELRYAQQAHEQGQIVYQRIADKDPLKWHEVTTKLLEATFPAWFADGRRLAFRGRDVGGSAIFVKDGEKLTRLVQEATEQDPIAVSPDGKHVAFASQAFGNADLFAVETETGRVLRLTTDEGNDRSPSWSRDGRTLLFSSDRTGEENIWMLDVPTGKVTRLTKTGTCRYPAISPVDNRLSWVEGTGGIAIGSLAGGEIVRPETPNDVAFAPSWSPDGRYLAVAASDWGNWNVYIVRTDGSDAVVVTKDAGSEGMPAWGPTGARVAIVSDRGKRNGVWLISNLDPYLQRLDNDNYPPIVLTTDIGE